MKRRINLFSKKKQEQPIPTFAFTVRNYGILVLCICIFLSIIGGGVYYFQDQKLQELMIDVSDLESQMAANDKIQGNIVFFINKKEQLKAFLKDDAEFGKYYTILNNTLADAKVDAKISSIDLGVGKNVNFVIQFTDFENSEQLLNFIETKDFLDHFEVLTLQSFSVRRSNANAGDVLFQLEFNGKFQDEKQSAN